MSSVNAEMNLARKKLAEVLGDDMKHYLLILKSWFRQNITREEFDFDARKLIQTEHLHLHNQFLLAILSKCHALGSSIVLKDTSSALKGKKVKSKKRPLPKAGFNQRFVPADAMKSIPQTVVKPVDDEGGIQFCSREMILPDLGMLHGRLLVTAWESGLDEVSDNAVNLLKIAVENLLKNIISAVLSRRSSYRLREKRFKYNMGVEVPKVFLRNSVLLNSEEDSLPIPSSKILPSQYEQEEMDKASFLACASNKASVPKAPVSFYDVLHAMQQFKPAIPSHTVYSTTVERVLQKMWHPSVDDLEQEELDRQEKKAKQELELQQSMSKIDWNKPPLPP